MSRVKRNMSATTLTDIWLKLNHSGTFCSPHHNPLIGYLQIDTLHNVHDAMATLQELSANCEQDQLVLSEQATSGLFYLMETVIHALRFELYHRQ